MRNIIRPSIHSLEALELIPLAPPGEVAEQLAQVCPQCLQVRAAVDEEADDALVAGVGGAPQRRVAVAVL